MAPTNFVHASGAGHGVPVAPHGNESAAQEKIDNPEPKPHWYSSFMHSAQPDIHDPEKGHHEYKNIQGSVIRNPNRSVEQYLSTTRYKPRKLLVQYSEYSNIEPSIHWRHQKVRGSVPTALRISEWTLAPAFPKSRVGNKIRFRGLPLFFLRTLLVALPLQLYMSFPIFTPPWEEDDAEDTYLDWPGYHWRWPRFAVNPLDMSPESPERHQRELSARPRLLRPRQLMMLENDKWVLKDIWAEPKAYAPYVMISYANRSFKTSKPTEGLDNSQEGRDLLRKVAVESALKLGLKAYWMDFECRAQEKGEQLDADVNRFCDVVRGARKVVIALKDNSEGEALTWGKRMWTLPEALLAPGSELLIYYCDAEKFVPMSKIEMAALFWQESRKPRENGADLQATRLLAEHFTGTLQLSRLQLMSTALAALWDRKDPEATEYTEGELSYALMGLLHSRIDHVEGNTLFQDIAKLSLLNDSDQLVERMICLLPKADTSAKDFADNISNDDPFRMLQREDEFDTHLWDIHPTCEVVGVDEQDRTVILNETRAIPIRWKRFPKILYKRSASFKKFFAEVLLRSGAWWFITGFYLIWTYAPFWAASSNADSQAAQSAGSDAGASATNTSASITRLFLGYCIALFFAVGALLSFLGPLSLRILYGGTLLEPAPNLIAFEGYMPIAELEQIMFGNDDSRLSYEPSSTPFAKDCQDPKERVGREPGWIKSKTPPPLLPGHRIFTLVDTGELAVSIFQAKRPPTVALICGREGGMLRAVLCSWRSSTDCLYKETVMRMPTETYEMAKPKGWLKLQLGRDMLAKVSSVPSATWSTR